MNATGRALLEKAMHIHLDDDFVGRVFDIAAAFPAVEYEGKMPNDLVFLEGFLSDRGQSPVALFAQRVGKNATRFDVPEDSIGIFVVIPSNPEDQISQFMCSYSGKDRLLRFGSNWATGMTEEDFAATEDYRQSALTANALDLLFTLMTEPRYVKAEPCSKLRRSLAASAIGKPALRNTWVKLQWTVGGETKAKGNVAGSAPQKAFHMVRAHWRCYDHQTPNSVERPGRGGHWVWIKAHYAGNPALGEIKHHYSPKLKEESEPTLQHVMAARHYQWLKAAS
jgi:hypothetical protein